MTLLLFVFTGISNAQFFEGFENGVPGSMLQSYNKGQTTWIDFGLSALNVDQALSENNSAVFFNAMETNEIITSLQTPVLDLSDPKMCLEFKYLQKLKTENYANILYVDLSNDDGNSWQQIAVYDSVTDDMEMIHINLSTLNPSAHSIIKFRSKQSSPTMGYPIVIDDISIHANIISTGKSSAKLVSKPEIEIFPNPSTGIFNLTTSQPVEVSVIDSNGRVVYNLFEVYNNTIIDLSQFAKGIYFAKIKSLDNQEVKKLILK